MKDHKVVTMVDAYHCESEISSTEGTFTLKFYGYTPGGKRVRFHIVLRPWWIRFLAQELWKVIAHGRKELAEAEDAMMIQRKDTQGREETRSATEYKDRCSP